MVLTKIDEIKAAEKPYFYRNKMEYAFSDKRWLTAEEIKLKKKNLEKNGLGFHKSGMWDKVVDIEKCHLQKDPANNIRNSVKKFALDNNLAFFNPREKSGFLRTLMIRNSNQGEFMVLIQFYRENKEQREAILNHLKDKFHLTALLYCINSKANDTLYDQEIIIYDGSEFITEVMEGLKFRVNAKSFFQTNAEQAYELYKITREFAGLKGHELVYDLYTGTGTIALFIAGKCKKVVGVESVPEAVAVAKENAEINGIKIINDSKSTNGESTAAALKSFENIFWIAGGQPKSDGIGEAKNFLDKVKEVFLIGKSTDFFCKEILKYKKDLQIHNCLSLEKATKLAFKKAAISHLKNYVVLLSPSAASFDQYINFEDRGNKFKEIVNQQLNEGLLK